MGGAWAKRTSRKFSGGVFLVISIGSSLVFLEASPFLPLAE
jgi:hypothetical protein